MINIECLNNLLDNDKIIELLISHEADKDSHDKNGRSPLHNAAAEGTYS